MAKDQWIIEGERATDHRKCWFQWYPHAEGGPRGAWVFELEGGTTFLRLEGAEEALRATTPTHGWPGLATVRIRRDGEAYHEGGKMVADLLRDAVQGDRYGYLTEADINTLQAYQPHRQLLVRASGCRFTTGACSVRHIADALGAYYNGDPAHGRGLDYVRDVCLPSSDPAWEEYRTERAASDAGHRRFYDRATSIINGRIA